MTRGLFRLSITARIAILSIALALASNLAVIVFVWQQTRAAAIDAIRRDVIEEADELVAAYRGGGDVALVGAVADAAVPDDPTLAVAILDSAGRRVAGVGPDRVAVPLMATRFRIARLAAAGGWQTEQAGYVLRRVGARWLLSGESLSVVEEQQRALERALAFAVLVSLALGIAAGLIVSHYVARRLRRIAGVIDAVGEGDLTRRVALAGGRDAFDRLAARLNATLDRVERLMAELRVVSDGLAHDLRSPLARLRSKTEQAVLLPPGAARDTALGGLLLETDQVMRMLTTVIEISRAEQVSRDRFVAVAPDALLEEIFDLYAPVAEDSGVVLRLVIDDRPPPPIALHRDLVSQAIANLIDNALRHGGGGGTVTLRLSQDAVGIAIAVEDRGPGIAAVDRAQARKRFGRLDSARSRPGAGLGMALVDAVARLHDGQLHLTDNTPGLIARIVLPQR